MKLLTVDLERPLPDILPPTAGEQWVLVRLHGEPIGILEIADAGCDAARLANSIADRFRQRLASHLVADAMADRAMQHGSPNLPCPQRLPMELPPATVAVCSRDGAMRLPECLDAVVALEYPPDRRELIVVDNAPSDDSTRRLVASRYPSIRYVAEPEPGLNRARNRAIREAGGEIIAFTDDDASPDRGWLQAIGRTFSSEPDVEALTGLVVPDEIDVEPQKLFEAYGGFARGFDRQYFRVDTVTGEPGARRNGGTGRFGTGANMAFRTRVFDVTGPFDPALDVGTPTSGGGDLEMFFRVVKEGGTLVYEPTAIVKHRHRRTYSQLKTQLANNGKGFFAYLVRSARCYPDERLALLRLGIWWFWRGNLRRLARSFIHPGEFPRDLIVAELLGSLAGPRSYAQSRRIAESSGA